jgi:PTS system cellobiose-specific IIA component
MEKTEFNIEEISFQLIATSGDARSDAIEAMQKAKANQIKEAEELLASARNKILETHKYNANLIHKEAAGQQLPFSLLLVHAQDHFMTSNTMIEMVEFIIDLYKK